jgi:hypothetical protein
MELAWVFSCSDEIFFRLRLDELREIFSNHDQVIALIFIWQAFVVISESLPYFLRGHKDLAGTDMNRR